MPTYQYSCTECGHFFEAVQSFSDESLTVCPECQGRLRKVFNAVGVVFKGSGFYRTDSRAADGSSRSGDSGSKEGSKDGAAAKSGDSGGKSSTSDSGSSAPSKSTSSQNGSGSSSAKTPAAAS